MLVSWVGGGACDTRAEVVFYAFIATHSRLSPDESGSYHRKLRRLELQTERHKRTTLPVLLRWALGRPWAGRTTPIYHEANYIFMSASTSTESRVVTRGLTKERAAVRRGRGGADLGGGDPRVAKSRKETVRAGMRVFFWESFPCVGSTAPSLGWAGRGGTGGQRRISHALGRHAASRCRIHCARSARIPATWMLLCLAAPGGLWPKRVRPANRTLCPSLLYPFLLLYILLPSLHTAR